LSSERVSESPVTAEKHEEAGSVLDVDEVHRFRPDSRVIARDLLALGENVGRTVPIRTLEARLRYVTEVFGAVRVDRLQAREVGAWRKRLPERSA
jgi:hypothetical protein